ncbi:MULTISPECIES: hypothetical protein [Burkholderia]|uniref:Uncharacterized protein n=1 Tax=Burkholderia vietnamiensis TaxID=60552 RepID=A0ABS1ARW0_BURVI|nr:MULTISPECIES: hypothetical protein [Burkholderia]MBJ9686898.1 hypothetical protein [Burkholderia vietnamiensis]MBR7918137.1 hypothetical protein [Burkholderia vietnamiensis]MBR8001415.1 hypothetical protein [Burkholderia vietnamiensis]MBR8204455.1 hypothetical protein [Burkholderia vietnamiensis]MCA8392667.1 hypothetical protein [Burkholderia vietnamiensis]
MQSMPGALTAQRHHRHFANPSVGWANFPPEKADGRVAVGLIKRLGVAARGAPATDLIWRARPWGHARHTVFISVSAQYPRTPMNSPLRSARPEQRPREAGFDEGCSLN